ncbi:hypothetical protein PM082_023745 [Marasmius tenuissimus]|nr:hypothetical protein PM082_023745 [Marasmius tenuissimus]
MSWASQLSYSHPNEFRWLPKLMFAECANPGCDKTTQLLCPKCYAVHYCSFGCQYQHEPVHIWECRGPIHTGHYLLKACNEGVVPSHRRTRKDYGFDKAGKNAHLLRLYDGLPKINTRITAYKLNRWKTWGYLGLCDRIKKTYNRKPPELRGDAYAWFLQNQWVLNPTLPPVGDTIEARCGRMLEVAWDRIGRDWSLAIPSWSSEARECLWHYAVILSGEHHSSFTDVWAHTRCMNVWTFAGYCTDKEDGRTVAQLYQQLFEQCPFDEYLAAYKSRKVYCLMEKYHTFAQLSPIAVPRHFSSVLKQGDLNTIPSVWLLKQSLLMGDTWPDGFVGADYGFINCTSEDERSALADVYLAAFRTRGFSEMVMDRELHKSRTFDYVSRFVPMLRDGEKMSELMRRSNGYPWFRVKGDRWYRIYNFGWLLRPVVWGLIGWGAPRVVRFIVQRTTAYVGRKMSAFLAAVDNAISVIPDAHTIDRPPLEESESLSLTIALVLVVLYLKRLL